MQCAVGDRVVFWQMKWNKWGFKPHVCAYRLNWAMRTSWEWWYEWDDTALQTQDSKFGPWLCEAEHATSHSRRLPTILNLYEWAGNKHFVSLKIECLSVVRIRDLRLSKHAALTTAPGSQPCYSTCLQIQPHCGVVLYLVFVLEQKQLIYVNL